MREKDYRKLYECEFPMMEPPFTRKDIFHAKIAGKPITVDVSQYLSEERDALEELLWHYGAFTPVEDYHGWYGLANITVNLKLGNPTHTTMGNWYQRMIGSKHKISRDEYYRRLKAEINK